MRVWVGKIHRTHTGNSSFFLSCAVYMYIALDRQQEDNTAEQIENTTLIIAYIIKFHYKLCIPWDVAVENQFTRTGTKEIFPYSVFFVKYLNVKCAKEHFVRCTVALFRYLVFSLTQSFSMFFKQSTGVHSNTAIMKTAFPKIAGTPGSLRRDVMSNP